MPFTGEDLLYRAFDRLRNLTGLGRAVHSYRVSELEISARNELLERYQSDLAKIFLNHKGRMVQKWIHYLELYERHLDVYRGTGLRFLEIGVSQGGSLDMWRKYLGPNATIFGIDIDPACADRVDHPNQVRIGSQADPAFLIKVVAEMGGVDIVLDDGSHAAPHQSASFAALFPLLNEGGLYIIEDLHTSYWPGEAQGGLKRRGTAIEMIKEMIDDMHRSYHEQRRPSHGPIGGIHIYDSIAFIEKRTLPPPRHIRIS